MTSKTYRKGVQAIVVDNENKFLIVNLVSYKENEWNFVGGGVEEGESFEEALIRELKEELNIDPADFKIGQKASTPIKYDFPEPILNNEGKLYYGQIKEKFLVEFKGDKNKIKLQKKEVRKSKWVLVTDLKEYLVFPGQLEDAITAIEELLPEVAKRN